MLSRPPTPPPEETAAHTPGLAKRTRRGKSGPSEPAAGAAQSGGFAEAPQKSFDHGPGALPALRNQALRPTSGTGSLTAFLDVLLAKPEDRGQREQEILKQQPMMAAHPVVAGSEIDFTPHRPQRPEKSEGGVRFDQYGSSLPHESPHATQRLQGSTERPVYGHGIHEP